MEFGLPEVLPRLTELAREFEDLLPAPLSDIGLGARHVLGRQRHHLPMRQFAGHADASVDAFRRTLTVSASRITSTLRPSRTYFVLPALFISASTLDFAFDSRLESPMRSSRTS